MPPKAASKRSRSAPAKDVAPVAPQPPSVDKNEAIAQIFDQLKMYEAKHGNKFAGMTYDKVARAVRGFKAVITSGGDLTGVAGIGTTSIAKIDEYLTTGTVQKLEEFKKDLGELPAELMSAAKAVSTKSAGDKGKGKVGDVVGTPLTAAQKKAVASAAGGFEASTIDVLKSLLRLNDGLVTGTKGELVERCAEGKALGALPRCPLCSAGKLRFNGKTGLYSCPGFMDDDKWAPCFFKTGSITRLPWKDA